MGDTGRPVPLLRSVVASTAGLTWLTAAGVVGAVQYGEVQDVSGLDGLGLGL